MLKGYMARESLGTPSLVKLTVFIQGCCEPVRITICSAKTLIFHRCKVFVTGLVTVQVILKNTNGNENKQRYWLWLTGVKIWFLTVLKHDIFFIRLNWFDCKKRIMQLFSV